MEINLSNSLIAKKRLLGRQTENQVPLRMKLKKKHTIHMLDYHIDFSASPHINSRIEAN